MSIKKETLDLNAFRFNENGLIPVVAQDYESGEVLMLAYMNADAVQKTFETGYAHYYSRSKKTVTKYGEALGNTQKLMVAFLDHDNDTLLIKVNQKGKADPEKGSFTCFPEQQWHYSTEKNKRKERKPRLQKKLLVVNYNNL